MLIFIAFLEMCVCLCGYCHLKWPWLSDGKKQNQNEVLDKLRIPSCEVDHLLELSITHSFRWLPFLLTHTWLKWPSKSAS